MHLDISRPQVPVDLYFGVEEVGALVGVEQSGVEHTNGAAIYGREAFRSPKPVLPDVVHQSFHEGKDRHSL